MIVPASRRAVTFVTALVVVFVFGVYLSMVPAGVGIGDEAEAQTVPYMLGIAHPTGFPVFVLAGWLWSHVLAFGTVAWRLNAFMAFITALTAGAVVLIGAEAGADAIASALAALVFAFGNGIWNGALHANAQPLAGMLGVYALFASVVFARSGDRRVFVVACACCGFGIATHPVAIFILPALAVALAWQWRTISLPLLAAAIAALCVPLLAYAYMPLRAAVLLAWGGDPTAGAPTFGIGVDWNMVHMRAPGGFADEVLGRHDGAASSLSHTFNAAIIPAAIAQWFAFAARQFNIVTIVIAAAGAAMLARTNLRAFSVLFAGTFGGVVFAYVYRTDLHIDRYTFVSFAIAAVLAAMSSRIRIPNVTARGIVVATCLILAALAVRAFSINRLPVAQLGPPSGEGVIAAIARTTPDDAIVITQWNDAAALGYGVYAAGALGSRLIVSAWPTDDAPHFSAWARARPLYVLESPLGVADLRQPAAFFGDFAVTRRPIPLAQYQLYAVESRRNILRRWPPLPRPGGIRNAPSTRESVPKG